jgi:hypothetical protein
VYSLVDCRTFLTGFLSWTVVDRYRFLLGDSFGRLAMLSLDATAMILIPLGEVISDIFVKVYADNIL